MAFRHVVPTDLNEGLLAELNYLATPEAAHNSHGLKKLLIALVSGPRLVRKCLSKFGAVQLTDRDPPSMFTNSYTCPLSAGRYLDCGNVVYGSVLQLVALEYPPGDGLDALTNRETAGDVIEAVLGIMYLHERLVDSAFGDSDRLSSVMAVALGSERRQFSQEIWDHAMAWGSSPSTSNLVGYKAWLEQTIHCVYNVIAAKQWWNVKDVCVCAWLIDDLRTGMARL